VNITIQSKRDVNTVCSVTLSQKVVLVHECHSHLIKWQDSQRKCRWNLVYTYFWALPVVTYRPIAWRRIGKHIPEQAYVLNNKTSIGRQRVSKHASLTREVVFSAWSVQSGYKEVFIRTEE
jgi:hypothetical protein